MKRLDDNGLTAQQEAFCQALARAKSQRLAYRDAFANRKSTDDSVDAMASRLAAQPQVRARLAAILRSAKIHDLLADGEHFAQCLKDAEAARTAENWTAVAAFDKQISQMKGMMRDNISITWEQSFTDQDLAERLSRGDAAKAKALRELLGGVGFSDTPDVVTKH